MSTSQDGVDGNSHSNCYNTIRDYGFDGLARVSGREFHGLQAKKRKSGLLLRAKDIATFKDATRRIQDRHSSSKGVLYTDTKLTADAQHDWDIQSQRGEFELHTMQLQMCPP